MGTHKLIAAGTVKLLAARTRKLIPSTRGPPIPSNLPGTVKLIAAGRSS